MRSIAESITHAILQHRCQCFNAVTRKGLARLIVQNIIGHEENLPVITVDKDLEQLLLRSMAQALTKFRYCDA